MKNFFSYNYGRLEYRYNEYGIVIQALIMLGLLGFSLLTAVVPEIVHPERRKIIIAALIAMLIFSITASTIVSIRNNRRGVKLYHIKTHGGPATWLYGYTGSAEDFRKYCAIHLDEDTEKIVMSANRSNSGLIMAVSRPGRHHHCFLIPHKEASMEYVNVSNQGFLTNKGRFVDREEALRIARNSGQMFGRTKTGYSGQLFSEDLW